MHPEWTWGKPRNAKRKTPFDCAVAQCGALTTVRENITWHWQPPCGQVIHDPDPVGDPNGSLSTASVFLELVPFVHGDGLPVRSGPGVPESDVTFGRSCRRPRAEAASRRAFQPAARRRRLLPEDVARMCGSSRNTLGPGSIEDGPRMLHVIGIGACRQVKWRPEITNGKVRLRSPKIPNALVRAPWCRGCRPSVLESNADTRWSKRF